MGRTCTRMARRKVTEKPRHNVESSKEGAQEDTQENVNEDDLPFKDPRVEDSLPMKVLPLKDARIEESKKESLQMKTQ